VKYKLVNDLKAAALESSKNDILQQSSIKEILLNERDYSKYLMVVLKGN